MITPISKPSNFLDMRTNILGFSGTKENEADELIQNIKANFRRNLDWEQVTKNFNDIITYDVWIYEGTQKDDVIGHKYLKSYPYDCVEFDIGDYIHWTYGGKEETWIISTINKQHLHDVVGKLLRCNNYLRWRDKNNQIISYPCSVNEKVNSGLFEFNNNIIIPQGYVFVTAQANEDTRKISVNNRFIFGNQSFKIQSINNFTDTNALLIIFQKDNISPLDDLENGIADNSSSGLTPNNPSTNLW